MELIFNVFAYAMDSLDSGTILSLLVITLSFAVYIVVSRKKYERAHYPPLAPGGMFHHVKMVTSAQYPWWLLDVAKQMNTRVFQLSLPSYYGRRHFVVAEPSTFRAILTDQFTEKPMEVYNRMRYMNGSGIPAMFTSSGSVWHSKRKAVSRAFSSNHVKRMNRLAIEKCEIWIQECLVQKRGESFDVSKEMIGIVLSAICETAFEYKMSKEEKAYLLQELELALVEFARKGFNILRARFSRFLPTRRRAIQAGLNLRRLCFKIMDEYRTNESKAEGTIIQLIMDSDDAFPTDDAKAAQLLEFLVAGFDTTGYSISWILLSLAQNKHEQTKIRESLSKLTPDTWNNSKELEWAIKEGMRLNPVASNGSIRTIGRNFTTSKGLVIPKGSNCILPFMLLFRNPDIFENPDAFIPSRWEHPTREQLDAFQPFSLGKQNCVGQSLAKAETLYIVARIISEFELSVDDSVGPFTCDFFLTLKPVGAFLRARRV